MEIEARKFNSKGIAELREVFDEARIGFKSIQAAKIDVQTMQRLSDLLFDEEYTVIIPHIKLNDDKVFASRLDLGVYLKSTIPEGSSESEYENVGFWAWVSILYIEQLLEPFANGKDYKLWSNVRYIPEAQLSKRRYYRHLCFLPYWICKTQPQETAEFFLIPKPYVHSEAIEQLYTSDSDFLPFPSVIAVAKRLYVNPKTNTYRKNFTGRLTAGSAVRLATIVVKQWQLNYDLPVLTADQIWEILPKEFDDWKRLAKASQ